jgi:hypothetical protein
MLNAENKAVLHTGERSDGPFEDGKHFWEGDDQNTEENQNGNGLLSKLAFSIDTCVISAIVVVIFF